MNSLSTCHHVSQLLNRMPARWTIRPQTRYVLAIDGASPAMFTRLPLRKVIANAPVKTATWAGQGQTHSGVAPRAPCAVRVLTMISPPDDKDSESNVGSNTGPQVLSASVVFSCPELQTQQGR